MKTWMVIFIGSRIFAVWADPMPGDMTLADCQIHADRWTARTAPALDPIDQPIYACVQRWFRPQRDDVSGPVSAVGESK